MSLKLSLIDGDDGLHYLLSLDTKIFSKIEIEEIALFVERVSKMLKTIKINPVSHGGGDT